MYLNLSLCSSGSSASGWMWWLMTGCPWRTGSCCSFTRRRVESSGALFWRRPTPSTVILTCTCESDTGYCSSSVCSLLVRQAERLLWGSVGRQHVWGLWGFHRRSHRDVRVKESTRRSLQHHRPRHRERIAAGLLYRRERRFSLLNLCWTQGYRWRC